VRTLNSHLNTGTAAMDSLCLDSVIHGHHIYKDIWTPFIGEILHVEQEAHNTADHFAVARVKMRL